ncbi:MAG: hypothetical protein ACKV1O_09520 [Saprospiraceae bacterium]
MEILKQLNLLTKTLLIAALSFLLYGYLCRLTGIYLIKQSDSPEWEVVGVE